MSEIVNLRLITTHYRERWITHLVQLPRGDIRHEVTQLLLGMLADFEHGVHEPGVLAMLEAWRDPPDPP